MSAKERMGCFNVSSIPWDLSAETERQTKRPKQMEKVERKQGEHDVEERRFGRVGDGGVVSGGTGALGWR